MSNKFLELLKEKIVIFDGAMGTYLQSLNLSIDDWGGPNFENCSENLLYTRPDAIESIPTIDFATAATLSSEMARLSDVASLQALLAHAADALGARGVIVWISGGDNLIAAAAHGYEAAVLRRIPSIARDADNATAVAWRTGQPGTVPEDASGHGAIVAPMMSADGCVGVFAAEVRGGRERDAATCAVAAILASQLAGVLAEWSAASTADRHVSSLDRKAAAS